MNNVHETQYTTYVSTNNTKEQDEINNTNTSEASDFQSSPPIGYISSKEDNNTLDSNIDSIHSKNNIVASSDIDISSESTESIYLKKISNGLDSKKKYDLEQYHLAWKCE